jgi:hypothetical protein
MMSDKAQQEYMITVGDVGILRTLMIFEQMTPDKLLGFHAQDRVKAVELKGLITIAGINRDYYRITERGYHYMIASLLFRIEDLEDRLAERNDNARIPPARDDER